MQYERQSDILENIYRWDFTVLQGFFHLHKSFELNFVIGGKLEGYIGKTFISAEEGEIIFVPSLFTHKIYSAGEKPRSFNLIIPISYFQLYGIDTNKFQYGILKNKEVNKKIFEFAEKIKCDGSLGDKAYFALLVSEIKDNYKPQQFALSKNDSLMVDIIVYIEQHFKEELTLESISNEFHFSRFYFSKLFNNMFHCPLTTYINTLRLQYIKENMNSKTSMLNLILEAGFQSISAYYRVRDLFEKNNEHELVEYRTNQERTLD